MTYVYGSQMCANCQKAIRELEARGEPFERRDAERLRKPLEHGWDEVDRTGLALLAYQEWELPVIFDESKVIRRGPEEVPMR